MSRQIQIRRGTAAEHQDFTGALGEVTMDTTNNTLRVHDGDTPGGIPLAKQSEIPNDIMSADYVVATQLPTAANNYTWYRKYKSGWVEQGGRVGGFSGYAYNVQITLPIPMADSNYSITTNSQNRADWTPAPTGSEPADLIALRAIVTNSTTPTGFKICVVKAALSIWQVSGMSAE